MLIDILKVQNGDNIIDILNKDCSDVEEKAFQELIDRKIAKEEVIKNKREQEKKEIESNMKKSGQDSAHNSNNSINKSNGNVTKSSASISKSAVSVSANANAKSSNNSINKSSNSVNKSNGSIDKSQNELDAKENEIKRSQLLSLSLHKLKESTFVDYKSKTLENLEKLEGYHEIKKEDNYQAMLNIIGKVNRYIYIYYKQYK